jgi:recombination protein RecA
MALSVKNKAESKDGAKGLSKLESVISDLDKSYGKNTVMRMSADSVVDVESISTGCLGIDLALGVGGVPKGRIVEVYGPESSGKTTLALHLAAQCQKDGGTVAFIDAEHALDTVYAQKLGVNVPETLISQPDCGEQALEIAEKLVSSGEVNLLIVDSVAALTPRAEIEGEMGASHMGLQARLMSQALRKLTGIVQRTNTTVVFINQLRMKIGVMFGNPETTTGGNALKFYASVRIDIRRIGALKSGDEIIGNRTKVKIAKNKVAPPFKVVEFDILYGTGIDNYGSVLDMAEEQGHIEKAGAWFSYKDQKIGQGRVNSATFLRENEDIFNEVKAKCLGKDKKEEVVAEAEEKEPKEEAPVEAKAETKDAKESPEGEDEKPKVKKTKGSKSKK